MMKILFVVLYLFANFLNAQSYIPADYFHHEDELFIDSFTVNNKIENYLIYQTFIFSDSLAPGGELDQLITFLIWHEKNSTLIKLISKDYIYKTITINKNNIFRYNYFSKVWAEETEDNLKFVPPVLWPGKSEVIICSKNNKRYYYEFGHVYTYSEDISKKTYRKEFIDLLKETIVPLLKTLESEMVYKRSVLFEEENNNE